MATLSDIRRPERYSLIGGPFGSKLVQKDYEPAGIPVIRGSNLPADKRFSFDDFVFVSPAKVDRDLRGNLAYPGDVIVTQRGTLGQVGLVPEASPYDRLVLSQSQMKLSVDKTKADPEFVYYALRSPLGQHEIISRALTAGVPHINLAIFGEIQIPLPPLQSQRKIAAVLSGYDELIENNRRRIKILEEMAERIYREWFIDFRFIGHGDLPLLDSPTGRIPQGWRMGELGELMTLEYGRALREDDRVAGDVLVMGSSGPVGWHDHALVKGPGVVVGRKGNAGSVHWVDRDFYPIDTVFHVKTEWPLVFVFYLLRGHRWVPGDTAVPGLSRHRAYMDPIVIPPKPLAESFTRAVAPMRKEASTLSSICVNLGNTRDLLLQPLTSGEIDVDNLDMVVPGAPV